MFGRSAGQIRQKLEDGLNLKSLTILEKVIETRFDQDLRKTETKANSKGYRQSSNEPMQGFYDCTKRTVFKKIYAKINIVYAKNMQEIMTILLSILFLF